VYLSDAIDEAKDGREDELKEELMPQRKWGLLLVFST